MKNMRKRIAWSIGIIVAVLFLTFFVSPFRYLTIYTTDWVDANTGRYRFCQHVLFRVHDEVYPTAISERWEEHFGAFPEPDWIRINRVPARRTDWPPGPIGGYHVVFRWFRDAFRTASFSSEAEEEIVRRFTLALQQTRETGKAAAWGGCVSEFAQAHKGEQVGVLELPDLRQWLRNREAGNTTTKSTVPDGARGRTPSVP